MIKTTKMNQRKIDNIRIELDEINSEERFLKKRLNVLERRKSRLIEALIQLDE